MISQATFGFVLSLALLSAPSSRAQKAGTFEDWGDQSSGVSAQQLFLGTLNKLYVLDKTENNPIQVNGHAAWGSEVDVGSRKVRAMDVRSNAFCAGGTVLGNGTWINVGGNLAVVAGNGPAPDSGQAGDNVYKTYDGRKAVRFLNPCDDDTCDWIDDPAMYMTTDRWYPTLETLEDGSAIIFGGCTDGGYVNEPDRDNPTYEYWPARNQPLTSLHILLDTMPVNLFPLVWLLPSGNILIQAGMKATIFDYKNNVEYPISDIPDCVRVYPASAATTVLPMTPANNWTASILFCGGSDINTWIPNANLPSYPASTSCQLINPDVEDKWFAEDALPGGRSMGEFINLPDGRLFLVTGAATGTAGYGAFDFAIGQSYGDHPTLDSWYFDKRKPSGQRWAMAGNLNRPRMYHSSAVLLPDGSVAVSGSNPNADFVNVNDPPNVGNQGTYKYGSDTSIEIFYPDYYDHKRPAPTGLPTTLTYGGDYFNVTLTKEDLGGHTININNTQAVVIRPGFATHCMNMGQRHIELASSFTTNDDGGATLHVSQLPPNPAILAPGPALFFIVVNGIPSQGVMIMAGDGIIGQHKVLPAADLPQSTISYEQAYLNQ